MHWKRLWAASALLLVLVVGCKQRYFVTEQDYNAVQTGLYTKLDSLNPELSAQPLTKPVGAPPTLENLDRKVRFISLAECIAIALEQGRVGQPSLLFPGTALDNLVQFVGPGGINAIAGSDAIRVLALDPAYRGVSIDASLSKFDAVWVSTLQYQTTDQPIATPTQNFQANFSNNITAINQVNVTPSTQLLKPLASGGVAGITFSLPYETTNLPARLNPLYQPNLQFTFEQPLLQGFGVEINQLRAAHPGSILNPGVLNTQTAQEGILISRLRFDQQRAEFERNINQMLLNLEVAYWNLYGGYWTLYSREQGLRFAYEAFRLSKFRYEAGQVKAGDFYQTRGQYELFRAQRIQAISQVLEFERQLRALLGMDIEDGCRLVPSDSPTLAPYRPNWSAALEEALNKRPELYMTRQEIKAAQMNLILAKNQLLPDLRFTSTYDFNSIGTRLDGPDINGPKDINALKNLAQMHNSDWSVALRLIVPIGFRFASTQIRQSQLALERAMETLHDQELKTQSYLGRQYEQISVAYEQIRANRAQREAFGEQLRNRYEEYKAGRGTLDILLEAQRFWADALNSEYAAIVTYNNALVTFEFAKGTILQHDNIVIAEGGLPGCAEVRAVEHERERTTALVLRERAAPAGPCNCGSSGPNGVSLPAALSATPPLKDVPTLPAVTEPGKKAEVLPAPTEVKPDDMFPPAPPPKPQEPSAASVLPPLPMLPSMPAPSTPAPNASVLPPLPKLPSMPTPSTPAPNTPAPNTPVVVTPTRLPLRRETDFGTVRTLPPPPPATGDNP
jgi:outer membrane protein TolC